MHVLRHSRLNLVGGRCERERERASKGEEKRRVMADISSDKTGFHQVEWKPKSLLSMGKVVGNGVTLFVENGRKFNFDGRKCFRSKKGIILFRLDRRISILPNKEKPNLPRLCVHDLPGPARDIVHGLCRIINSAIRQMIPPN